MARTYLYTDSNPIVKDSYGDTWQQADLTIKVDASGKGTWSLKMTNKNGYNPSVSLHLSINNTEIYDLFENRGTKFPCKNNSTASGTFTVTGDSFDVDLRVCCSQSAILDAGGTDNRHRWDTAATKSQFTFYRKYYDSIQGGTVSIKDNYNNTFTISATNGQDGQGNPTSNTASAPSIKYGYSTTTRSTSCTNGATKTLTLSDTGTTRTVYAIATYSGSLGGSDSDDASLAIRQYKAPKWKNSTVPVISYTKNRLTLKENWTISWPEAEKQGYSNVVGYRIRVYVNGYSVPFAAVESNGSATTIEDPDWTLGGDYEKNRYFWDTDSTTRSFTLDPMYNQLNVGDKIQIGVYAYTKDGKGNFGLYPHKGSAGPLLFSAEKRSVEYEVQNAGIARVKVAGTWREGQVWVKANGTWHEAESVQTKVSGAWKEAQ